MKSALKIVIKKCTLTLIDVKSTGGNVVFTNNDKFWKRKWQYPGAIFFQSGQQSCIFIDYIFCIHKQIKLLMN